MRVNDKEPDHSKPCTVLFDRGMTRWGTCRLELQDFAWVGDRWLPLDKPRRTCLYPGLREADWVGRLPHQGRKRRSLNQDKLDEAIPLFEHGATLCDVCDVLKCSKTTAKKLRDYWFAQCSTPLDPKGNGSYEGPDGAS